MTGLASTPLYVPVQLDVLLVNDQVRSSQPFQRWTNNYDNLAKFLSPEPGAFDRNTAADWRHDPSANGAYLHWTLPQGLRHGAHDDPKGNPQFPLAPNRWLVLRYSGSPGSRQANAWVIDSDALGPTATGAAYVHPFKSKPEGVLLGKATPIASWSESGGRMFLTALGPGDPAFAAYQPAVNNIFSFHDALSGVDATDTLSYLVTGWFSDPSGDPLANPPSGQTVQEAMAGLGWDLLATGMDPDLTIFHGMAYGLAWDKTGPPPQSDKPQKPSDMTVAVGQTGIDAMTALVAELPASSGLEIDPEVLEAFQYDLLAQYSDPSVHGELWRRIHAGWFAQEDGGSIWRIVDADIDAATATGEQAEISPAERKHEERWLAKLNQRQQELDAAVAELAARQRELYDVWWKKNTLPNLPIYPKLPDGVTKAQFDDALDPTNTSSLVSQVENLRGQVALLLKKVPHGETEEELQTSIERHARAEGLPPSRVLKRTSLNAYHAPNNPVVLIGGLNNPAGSDPDQSVMCRLADELIIGFYFNRQLIDSRAMKGAIPAPDLSALPEAVSPLIDEFFFLDPNNAALVAQDALGGAGQAAAVGKVMAAHSALDGVAPDETIIPLQPWSQPWRPLYLQWEVNWYPIEYGRSGACNWSFDGESLEWNGHGADTSRMTGLSGRIFLTPNIQFNMRERVKEYLSKHPNPPLKNIDALLDAVDQWDLLSQSLDGFEQQLAQRQPLAAVAPFGSDVLFPPKTTLPDLIGDAPRYAPNPGVFEKPNHGAAWPPSIFEGLRSGQFFFTRLMVVDNFGQAAEIVNSSNDQSFAPILAPGVTPSQTVLPVGKQRFVQIAPRMQQPARLAFDMVDSGDDTAVEGYVEAVNPIIAWVLPNHLDAGLSIFAPDGQALGEMQVVADRAGAPTPIWIGAPDSPYQSVASLKPKFKHLADMLAHFDGGGPSAVADFEAFLASVDESLWAVDPLGARDDQTLSVLLGRPLALVRAKLKFELLGPPGVDPTWRFTFAPATPDYLKSAFSISLGNASVERDGLIGYFVGTDYDSFFAAQKPEASPAYIQPIGPGTYVRQDFELNTETFVTMLVDPRSQVNAYCGVVPSSQVELAQPAVNAAMAAMEVTFSLSPLLSQTVIAEAGPGMTGESGVKVSMLIPATKAGRWSWLSQTGGVWDEFEIDRVTQTPRLSSLAPELRSGLLKLSGSLGSK